MIFEIKRIIFILSCVLNGYKLSAGNINSESDEYSSYDDWDLDWVSLEKLDEVNELDLFDTHIPLLNEEIFETNNNLTRIALKNNNIQLIDEQTFNNFNETLEKLQITSNNLKTFNIEPIAKLKELNLKNNSLKILNNINFQKMSLLILDVSYNNLTEIYCYNVHDVINLSHNDISNICRFSKDIEKIYLSYNNIKNIENIAFNNLNNLQVLDLSHNQIVDFDYTFQISNTLSFLNLSYNQLTKFDIAQFRKLEKLTKLDLSHNNISVVHKNRNIRLICSFPGNEQYCFRYLNELYLHGNPIREINSTFLFETCYNLHKISISFAEISCSMLQHHITELHDANIVQGPFRNEENIHGIRCNSSLNTLEDSDKIDSMLYVLERIDAILIVLAFFSAIFVIVAFVVVVKRSRSKIITC